MTTHHQIVRIGDEYLIKHNVGRSGEPLYFAVKVIETRENFGRTEYLVEPVNGTTHQRHVQRSTLLDKPTGK